MTEPALAKSSQTRFGDGPRIYSWPPNPPHEFEVISVTSALKAMPKPFLLPWAVKKTAERAVDKYDWLGQKISNEGEKEALRWLKGARYDDMNEKADRGSIVHAAIEAYVAGKPFTKTELEDKLKEMRVPLEMWKSTAGMIAGAMEFLWDKEPEVLASESTVFSRQHGYAGTFDLLANVTLGGAPPKPVVIDFKTSKSIYDEVACQLAAYARADFIGTGTGQEIALPSPIDTGIVVRPMATGRYEAVAFALTDDVFNLFLGLLQVSLLHPKLGESRRPSL